MTGATPTLGTDRPRTSPSGVSNSGHELIKRAHAQAIENLFDAVVVTDLDGRIVDWNPGSERLYGYTRGEILGRSVTILHIPEQRDHVLADVLQSVERTGRWQGEVGLLRKDGSRGWIESSVVLIHDHDGEPVGALGINRDITARVEAERELAAAESRFRSLVEHSLVGIYIIRERSFVYVNPRFEEIFGYGAEELKRIQVLDLVTAEDRARVAENLRHRLRGERLESHYAFRAVRRSGEVIEVEVHGTGIDLAGEPAVIGMVQDVTEQRTAERQLRESEERYRLIVDDMLGRVAAVIASREQLRARLLAPAGAAGDAREAPGRPPVIDPGDARFLRDVQTAVEAHLGDEAYTVERLAHDVAHSRSQLHRRLRQLVNETPSNLIRNLRLQEGARLLTEDSASVAEIAHAVGFKSVSHFSNRFLDRFGCRPSAYRDLPPDGEP